MVRDVNAEDVSDSELSSDMDGNDLDESGNNSEDSDGLENWDGIDTEDFNRDIPPLPEPNRRKSRLQQVNALVFWLVYFLLIWQTSCKLSDNGLVWLLQFLFKFLKVLGISVSNEFLAELIVICHHLCICYASLSTWIEIILQNMLFVQNAQSCMHMMHALQ